MDQSRGPDDCVGQAERAFSAQLNGRPGDVACDVKTEVPASIPEAIRLLGALFTAEEIQEGIDSPLLGHHFRGMWIRNSFGPWAGLALAKSFNRIGGFHPDDMSAMLLGSLHKIYESTPVRFGDQVRSTIAYWVRQLDEKATACPECGAPLSFAAQLKDPEGRSWEEDLFLGECPAEGSIWVFRKGPGLERATRTMRAEYRRKLARLEELDRAIAAVGVDLRGSRPE